MTGTRGDQFAELHPHCCQVLLRVAASPTLSPRAIARALGLKLETVKWALMELWRLGLIQPGSGTTATNAKRLMLTTLGEVAVQKVIEIVSARRWLKLTELQTDIDLLRETLRMRSGE